MPISKKMSFPKSYYMWGVFQPNAAKPHILYGRHDDAKSKLHWLHTECNLTWGKAIVKRVLIVQQTKTHFDIYKHEFKRI